MKVQEAEMEAGGCEGCRAPGSAVSPQRQLPKFEQDGGVVAGSSIRRPDFGPGRPQRSSADRRHMKVRWLAGFARSDQAVAGILGGPADHRTPLGTQEDRLDGEGNPLPRWQRLPPAG